MIIDDNKPNSFVKPMPNINNNHKASTMPYKNNTPIRPDMLVDNQQKTINPLNNSEMSNQALAMLKQRYENGLISIEEFKKGCEKINRNR